MPIQAGKCVCVGLLLVLVSAPAFAQAPDSADDATNVVEPEQSCGGRAATVLCAQERLAEKGFAWLIPAILLVGIGSWVWSFVRARTSKQNADDSG